MYYPNISCYKIRTGICTITIDNIRKCKNWPLIIENLVNTFLDKNEIFFGFYRCDGFYLTPKESEKYHIMINDFFKKTVQKRKSMIMFQLQDQKILVKQMRYTDMFSTIIWKQSFSVEKNIGKTFSNT